MTINYDNRRKSQSVCRKQIAHEISEYVTEPTHSKTGEAALFDTLHKWKPVREVLDLEDEGKSIFDRKKPLSDKTLERIYAGLIKFVAGGKQAFMVKYNSLEDRCPTVATQGRLALASVQFLSKQFSGSPDDKNISIEAPAGTITTVDHHALIHADFLCSYNFKDAGKSIDNPCPTLLTRDRLALVQTQFIAYEYSGGGQISSIDSPNPAVLTNPKQKLVSVCPWVMDPNYSNVGSSIDEPSRVITANRKHHYLMNPQFASPGGSVDSPCFTLIAKMDKRPPYLISTESGDFAIAVYDTDSPIMVKIKEFMALYRIVDIKMRMLKISELKLIMGFPEDYVLIGTQADQKKFIGNAVEVTIARAWCVALCDSVKRFAERKTA